MSIKDEYLKTEAFKVRLQEADDYVKEHHTDIWATRVFWVGLTNNVSVARRYAMRRPHHQSSAPWICYMRLVDAGIFSESPEGVVGGLNDPYWGAEENTHIWMDACINVAAGGEMPKTLPRREK